jgi:glycine dehydrogenase subunit 1
MADYIPATAQQQKEMLSTIGFRSLEDLFQDIPESIRLKRSLNLPDPLSEIELSGLMRSIAARNSSLGEKCCFLGAGAYDHYIPSAVKHLTGRQEFYTAYTPYQPEISQGTLQAIFEYQSMICELTGMDVANASMYDGASSLAEACLVAVQATRRRKILVSDSIHPDSRDVLLTYARFSDLDIEWIARNPEQGTLSLSDLEQRLDPETAAVVVQYPNFFGVIDDLTAIVERTHQHKAKCIVSADPIALGLLQTPGEAGADLVVGDGQALGNSLSFGGPSLGFFAVRKDLMRRMPGRIVGETKDARGQRRYVLTLQTREQHIRREKATSNICTNQGLNALTATIYLALMGPSGLARVAELSTRKTHFLRERLLALPGFQPVFNGPFFKEFAIRYDGDLAALNDHLYRDGFIGGLIVSEKMSDMDGVWLLAVTEKRTDEEIDRLVMSIQRYISEKEGR